MQIRTFWILASAVLLLVGFHSLSLYLSVLIFHFWFSIALRAIQKAGILNENPFYQLDDSRNALQGAVTRQTKMAY